MSGARTPSRNPAHRLLLAALTLLLATGATASPHVPGMSLTAEIFAENDAVLQSEDAPSDSSAADAPAPRVAPDTPGTITGYVRDLESGKGLPYTNIVLYRRTSTGALVESGGSIALTGGQFFARVNPGTYQVRFLYLGYENNVPDDVEVTPGATVTLDAAMKVKPIEFAALTVQAQKITGTAVAQIAEKKKAVAVQEAITAEEISKSTDSDAAEAVQRVPGVTVSDNKFVFVRGLGDRYSSTTLNGAPLSSPEPGRETVPLDIFPAAMLDNIVVKKAYTPDMDGNFGGGNIDIRTKRGVDDRKFNQKLSYGYAQSVLDEDFYTYDGGATDLLALDDGTRDLERMVPGFGDVAFNERNASEDDFIAATFRGNDVWTPRLVEGPPNFGYTGLYGDSFAFGERKGSYVASASYSHSAKTDAYVRYDVRNVGEPAQQETRSVQSERGILIGLTGAANFQPTRDSNLQYNLLYTRSGEDQARRSVGQNDSENQAFLTHTLKYVERDLMTHVLQGRHTFGGHGSELHWLVSTSDAARSEPDNRFTKFNWADDDAYTDEAGAAYNKGRFVKANLGTPAQRYWSETEEDSRHLQLNWTAALPELPWIRREMKFGFAYRERDRDESLRRFTVNVPSAAYRAQGRSGRLEDTLSQEDFGIYYGQAGDYNTRERTNPYDAVEAQRLTTALYGMFDVDFFDTIRVNAGARYEVSAQDASSLSLTGEEGGLPAIRGNADTDDWLPAANATWRIVPEKVQVRLAYSKTLNRPQLRELAAIRIVDFELDEEIAGNPFVRPAEVEAFDVRFEAYPGPSSYAGFSYFDKTIDGAIQTASTTKAGGGRTLFPFNGEPGGKLNGWEIEWRGPVVDMLTAMAKPLHWLSRVPGMSGLASMTPDDGVVDASDLPALSNFSFTFNYTSIDSEIEISPGSAGNEARFVLGPDGRPVRVEGDLIKTRLTGQADSALNLGIFYDNGSQDASLLFKDFGTLQRSAIDNTLYDAPLIVDTAFSTKIGSNLKLKLSVEDLFPGDDEVTFERLNHRLPDGSTSNLFYFNETSGRKYGASLSYDF